VDVLSLTLIHSLTHSPINQMKVSHSHTHSPPSQYDKQMQRSFHLRILVIFCLVGSIVIAGYFPYRYPLTHSLTHSLKYSLTHSNTHSLTQILTHSNTHSLTYTCMLISYMHIYLFTRSFIYLLPLLMHSYTHIYLLP
jgi:hypothetical protein